MSSNATIASLSVALGLTSDAFTAGLKKAEKGLGQFTEYATSAKGLLTGALAAVGIGASVDGIKEFVKGQMEAIDSTAKLSDRLGISTEALTGLQHAASLAGVSGEELSTGIGKMLQALAGADDEGGKAAKAFADIGLSMEQLSGRDVNDIFLQVASGLKAVDNPAQRAADAVAIFGKAGQSLLPLLMSGAEGIKAAQAEAERLGLTFSRMDAAKVEAANDAMTRMHAVLVGVGRTIAIEVAPYVEALANAFIAMGTDGKAGTLMAAAGVSRLTTTLAAAADYAKLLEAIGMGIGLAFARVPYALASVSNLLIQNSAIFKNSPFGQGLKTMAEDMDKNLTKLQGDMNAALGEFSNGTASKAAATGLQQIQSDADKAAKAVGRSGGAFHAMGQEVQGALEPLKRMGSALEGLEKEVATFGMSQRRRQLFDVTAERNAIQDQLQTASTDFFKITGGATTSTNPAALAKLAEVRVLAKQLDDADGKVRQAQSIINQLQGLDAQQDAMQKGAQLETETRSPLEKFAADVQGYRELSRQGAIDWATYARSVAKAGEELDAAKVSLPSMSTDAFRSLATAAPTFLETGTAAVPDMNGPMDFAFQPARTNASTAESNVGRDGTAALERLLNELVREARDATGISRRILDETKTGGGVDIFAIPP